MPKPYINKLSDNQTVTFVANKLFNSNENYANGTSTIKGVNSIRVKAPLPENITFGTANEVNQTWDFWKFKSAIVQTAAPTIGKNFDRGISERFFWRSIENKEITMELSFAAYYSGLIDVVQPINDLMILGAPVENSLAGGPNDLMYIDAHWDAPPLITVHVGKLLYFTNAIIKDINVSFSNKLDNEFYPMSAQVSVTFITSDPIGYAGLKGYGSKYSGFKSRNGSPQ